MRDQRAHILLLCFGMAIAGYGGCSGGQDTTSSSATGVEPMPAIAARCTSDNDCGPGLICILPSADDPVFGGGPANGYCSKSCSTDHDCFGPQAASCLLDANAQSGLCVLTCTIGPPLAYLNDALDPAKCNGRNDESCVPLSADTDVCVPVCGEDSQCPPGRVCDPRSAVCVDKANTGKPWGALCDPKAMAPECAGLCLTFTPGPNGVSACTSPCVLGGDLDPTKTPNCGGPERGYCIYKPSPNGAGDQGYCAVACTLQDDCQGPTFWCRGITGLTGTSVNNGYCVGSQACPNGQGDCSIPGTMCTPTKFGPFCLDLTFPLGNDAPGDGGVGDAAPGDAATD